LVANPDKGFFLEFVHGGKLSFNTMSWRRVYANIPLFPIDAVEADSAQIS
jgi:hypothetical protein